MSNPPVNAQHSHLRAYLAGTGATGSLIAGAAVTLLSLGAFLAFNGNLPFGSSDGDGSAYVGSGSGGGAAASARRPARAGAPFGGARRAAGESPAGSSAEGTGGGSAAASGSFGGGGTNGGQGGSGVTPPGGGNRGSPSSDGPLTHAASKIGQATGQDVSGATGVTRQIDRTAGNALNGAGGAAGKAHLGDDAGKAVNGLTDRPSEAGGNQGLTGANR